MVTGHVVSAVCFITGWGSNIVIGLYIQGMWSVLCVPYVGGRMVGRYLECGHVVFYDSGWYCTYWTCGQCCVSHMCVRSNIAICMYWTCGQCCVFHTWVLASNIAIRVYVLDMWSVLCVPYVGVSV